MEELEEHFQGGMITKPLTALRNLKLIVDPKSLSHAMRLAKLQEGAYYALWGLDPPRIGSCSNNVVSNEGPRAPYSNGHTQKHTSTFSPAPTALPVPRFMPTMTNT